MDLPPPWKLAYICSLKMPRWRKLSRSTGIIITAIYGALITFRSSSSWRVRVGRTFPGNRTSTNYSRMWKPRSRDLPSLIQGSLRWSSPAEQQWRLVSGSVGVVGRRGTARRNIWENLSVRRNNSQGEPDVPVWRWGNEEAGAVPLELFIHSTDIHEEPLLSLV